MGRNQQVKAKWGESTGRISAEKTGKVREMLALISEKRTVLFARLTEGAGEFPRLCHDVQSREGAVFSVFSARTPHILIARRSLHTVRYCSSQI